MKTGSDSWEQPPGEQRQGKVGRESPAAEGVKAQTPPPPAFRREHSPADHVILHFWTPEL